MAYEYLLSTLPPIFDEELFVPKIGPKDLWEMIRFEDEAIGKICFLLLLSFDILCLEDISRGIEVHEPGIFEKDNLKNGDGIPFWLTYAVDESMEITQGYPFDLVWREYYKQLSYLSMESGDLLFANWVEFDYKIRKDLEELREKESLDDDFFKQDRLIFKKRMDWLRGEAPRYTFDNNELLGYVMRYLTLKQGGYLI